jgi:hypothetical protein
MDVFYNRLMKDDQQHFHSRHSYASAIEVVTDADNCSPARLCPFFYRIETEKRQVLFYLRLPLRAL